MGGSKGLNSKDKNSIIMACVLIALIVLSVVFFKLSRSLPMIYIIIGVEAFEIFYVIPSVCKTYYKLYGMDGSGICWIPYANVFSIFSKPCAIASIIMLVITLIVGFLALGPMFWVTMENLSFVAELQYRAYGWFIVCIIVWSIVIGIGYSQVMRTVNSMRAEFLQAETSKAEFVNYALSLLPIGRCYTLFNLLNSMHFLINAGYEYGKDYTQLDLQESLEEN